MANYYTADNHFDHKNILKFEDRPFETMDELKEGMIEAWNSVVKEEDTVYHMGDFVFGSYTKWVAILERLNGRKVLIQGNHDSDKVVARLLKEGYLAELHPVGMKQKLGKHNLWLTHYPQEIGIRPNKFSIHGHIHAIPSRMTNQINVGVDSQLLTGRKWGVPVHEDELLNVLDAYNGIVQYKFDNGIYE